MMRLRLSSDATTNTSTGMRPVLSSPYLAKNASTNAGLRRVPSRSNTSANSSRAHKPGTPPRSRLTTANACLRRSRSLWLNDANALSFFLSSFSFSASLCAMSSFGFPPRAPEDPVAATRETGGRRRLPSTGSARPRRTSPHLLVDQSLSLIHI